MRGPRPPQSLLSLHVTFFFLFTLKIILRAMMGIVEEFEKTISQLISEKERESVCNVIARER